MKIISYFNERLRHNFTVWDIKLLQLAAMFLLILLIKFFPQIITLDFWVYFLGMMITVLRPLYALFLQK